RTACSNVNSAASAKTICRARPSVASADAGRRKKSTSGTTERRGESSTSDGMARTSASKSATAVVSHRRLITCYPRFQRPNYPLELRARNAKGRRSQPRCKLHALRRAGSGNPCRLNDCIALRKENQEEDRLRRALGKPPHVEGTARGTVDGRGMPGGSGEPLAGLAVRSGPAGFARPGRHGSARACRPAVLVRAVPDGRAPPRRAL